MDYAIETISANGSTKGHTTLRDTMTVLISGDFGGGTAVIEYGVRDLNNGVWFPDEALEFEDNSFTTINAHNQLKVRVTLADATNPDLTVAFLT